ncbi:uncharacterized protein LOC135211360 [Macrobrachium nipponense]|uniref:uncharacterized protein LOC135211360 n=1 Tax=Macrobrachium nipponense TaxID=159736 RepID=UPI0030C7A744
MAWFSTRCQQVGEHMDEYLQDLKLLSKECHFQVVTATQYCEESIRDVFISGTQPPLIRQRLLEDKTLDLATMFDHTRPLESAQRDYEVYCTTPPYQVVNAETPERRPSSPEVLEEPAPVMTAVTARCLFLLWFFKAPHLKCPAREASCHKCQERTLP